MSNEENNKNNNIEDFFNKSLEQFNEAPSDAVWKGLSERMALDKKPPGSSPNFWLIGLGLLFLLGLGLGLLFLKMNQTIHQLEKSNIVFQEDIKQLHLEIKQYKEQNQLLALNPNPVNTLLPDTVYLPKPISNQNNHSKLGSIEKQTQQATAKFKPTFGKETLNQSISFIEAISNRTQEKNNHKTNNQEVNSQLNKENAIHTNNNSNSKKENLENQKHTYNNNNNTTNPIYNNPINKISLIDATQTKNSKPANNTGNSTKLKSPYSYWLSKQGFAQNSNTMNTMNAMGKRLSWGFDLGVSLIQIEFPDAKNLKDIDIESEFNVRSQYSLSPRLALTGALGYSYYSYQIDIDSENLLVMKKFRGTGGSIGIIQNVFAEKHVINFSLGFQYDLIKKEKWAIYLEPSANWLFYFPQHFHYQLLNETHIEYTDRRMFIYFGSINTTLGFKKSLKNGWKYQLGLYREQSLIPLGIEAFHQTNFGIKSGILF